MFLHKLPDIKDFFEVVARERKLLPTIVEKDYWLTHCLWGIQQQGFQFELKGGTSLSKGFAIIERFSEDIDIQIHPLEPNTLKVGKNQNKPTHIQNRREFFDKVALQLNIPEMKFSRDHNFDDLLKMRGAGVRGEYPSLFSTVPGLKEGLVLELGFDQTIPFVNCDITSWALEKAFSLRLPIIDNRAKNVHCYCPEYTFVEKLHTISTKYRLQQENTTMPVNFPRHYYDVYKLLESDRVLNFIGSKKYYEHKEKRFRSLDERNIAQNPAFTVPDIQARKLFDQEFQRKSAIYFGKQPTFSNILQRIAKHIHRL
ncbi:MAG: nucleotidyl transferase AbiEii/AbiGii toxin family protein [Gammaproteobacteria bacterium]